MARIFVLDDLQNNKLPSTVQGMRYDQMDSSLPIRKRLI